MPPSKPRLIPLPEELFGEDPIPALLKSPLPHGEPWGWLLAHSLFKARHLARRLLRSSPAGLVRIVEEDLQRLREVRLWLREQYALSDLGCREATASEWAALEVIEHGNASSLTALYRQHGLAPFSCNTAFTWNGELEPVTHPDPVDFDELVGYEPQVKALLRNVERFLSGKPALPTLLYGARGTGKSTAVKALRTRFADRGLRLVEVLPEGLSSLPRLLEELHGLPQRFLLYVDDLAYDAADPGWRKLKGILDGAVWATPSNTLLIATSNRKNIIREGWSDRPDPTTEPGAWDSLQEKLALADRFGLHITFPPFDQKLYLKAVAHHLGREKLDGGTRAAALRFAMNGHGFSGRTAKQFADISS
ncbi:ATP-binding protein [Oceanithermus sp.]